MTVNIRKLMLSHFLLPLVVLIAVSMAINALDLDRILADYIYAIQGNSWAWKDKWITEVFFHKGGRAFSLLVALMSLMVLIVSFFHPAFSAHKKALLYLFLATVGGSLLVSFLKSLLAVSCPWEFDRYGGNLVYSRVFEQLFLRNGVGCFPAGQASAGYAWVSCYFFGLLYQSRWRWTGLVIPLLAGVVLGFAQQLRGAHFISHDIWTLAICWFYSLALFLLFFSPSQEKLSIPELVCP